MNKNIKRLKVFPTLLLSGAVALSLCTCTKKEGHEIIPPTMEESFYDNNDEGIDDLYESLVEDSDFYIEKMNKIEKMISLLDRIQELDKDISFDKDSEYLDYYINIEYSDQTIIDVLEEIERHVSFYERNPERMSLGAKEMLTEDYHRIVGYLLYVGPKHIEKVLLDLAKVVGASTLDLDSIDDIKVYIDVHHLGLNGAGIGWYNYEDESEEKTVVFDGIDSDLYDLVSEHLYFYDNASYFPDFYNNTENVKDLVDEYRKALTLIKNTVHNDYELVNGTFDSNQIIKIKK